MFFFLRKEVKSKLLEKGGDVPDSSEQLQSAILIVILARRSKIH